MPTFLIFSFLNLYPRIVVTADGIRISYNHFQWLLLEWEQLKSIQYGRGFGMGARLFFKHGKFIHRLTGSYFRHAIWIDTRMPGADELLDILEARLR